MLGTYALSSGYYDAYYGTAQKVRTRDQARARRAVRALRRARLADLRRRSRSRSARRSADPLAMYLTDVLTIPSNMAGPAEPVDPVRPLRRAAGRPPADRPAVLARTRSSASPTRSSRRSASTRPGAAAVKRDDLGSPSIGLEIHVQLKTQTKMFCRCRERLRRRAEHADLPRLPRVPRRAAGAEPARDRGDDQARPRARLHDRRAGRLPPQELLLSRTSRRRTRSASTTSRSAPTAASPCRRRTATSRSGSCARTSRRTPRRTSTSPRQRPHPRRDGDARRLQPRRHAAASRS